MRTFSLVLLLALPLTACGSSSEPGTEDTSSDGSSGGDADDGTAQGMCPQGGTPPVEGANGIPDGCEVLFEGCCYRQARDACAAAGCGDDCTIMESYPGQLNRCE